jgi:hypothetical protein
LPRDRATTHERSPASLLRGRFRLLRLLGRGAVGDVYEAVDQDAEHVAIKVLRDPTPEGLLSLKREFRAIQGVLHPNLVRLSELFEEDGRFFFSMELVSGVPFVAYVRGHNDNGSQHEQRLRRGLMQLVAGLSALHAAGKVHRDVKSSNVLVEPDGRAVLLDFGIALDASSSSSDGPGVTGTTGYMAPEQALGENVGPAADFYALGVLLFECLTGRLPFEGSLDDVLGAKMAGRLRPPSALATEVAVDLDQLCVALLRADPAQRPTAPQILERLRVQAPVRVSMPPPEVRFVGRQRELEALERAWDRARSAASVVVVRGRSGVGKSCLAQHFTEAQQRSSAALVLRGRCYERESLSYKGVDAVIDGLAGYLETLPAAQLSRLTPGDASLLARAFPVLRAVFGTAPAAETHDIVPEQLRQRTFAALRALLTSVAHSQRLLIVIDDVQWSDADSLALLHALLVPPDAPPLLWLLMLRTDATHAVELKLPGEVEQITVDRLTSEDAELLARQLLVEAQLGTPPRGLASIVREADGQPLFIAELVRSLGHARQFISLDDALWARVERCEDLQRELVELLCVAGSPVAAEVVARALGLSAGALLNAHVQLQAERLVRSESSGAAPLLAVYHDRVRESVRSRLGAPRCMALHRRLAEAMEAAGRADHDALAYHWEEAGEPGRATEHLRRAADDATAQLAFERAALLLERLLARSEGEPAERAALEQKLAEAWTYAGHGARSAAVRLQLAESLPAEGRFEQRRLAAQELLTSGRYDEGMRVLRLVIDEAKLPYPRTPGKAIAGIVWRKLQARLRGTSLAKRTSPPGVDETLRTDACFSALLGLLMVDPIRGNYYCVRNLIEALDLGDPVRAVPVIVMEALSGGGPDKAWTQRLLGEARRLVTELDRPDMHAMMAMGDGGIAYFWGHWPDAVSHLRRAERLLRDHCVNMRFFVNNSSFMLHRSLMARGALVELAAHVPAVLREAEKREDRWMLANLYSTPLVALALSRGDLAEATEHLKRSEALLPAEGYHVHHYFCALARVQMALHRGEATAALVAVEGEIPKLKKAVLSRIASIRTHVQDLRGRAALLAGLSASGTERTAHLRVVRDASAQLKREVDGWSHVYALLLDAGVAGLGGDQELAARHLEAARAQAERSGMDLHAAAATARLARLKGGENADKLAREAADSIRNAGIRDLDVYLQMTVPVAR